jgi:hypothetical protein
MRVRPRANKRSSPTTASTQLSGSLNSPVPQTNRMVSRISRDRVHIQPRDRAHTEKYGLEVSCINVNIGLESRVSSNPFDNEDGGFGALVDGDEQQPATAGFVRLAGSERSF